MNRLSRRSLLVATASASSLAAPLAPLRAQEAWPNRPVRFIVPFPPGQGVDIVARLVADQLSQRWPQRVVVENRAGGGGAIGMEAAARSAPDGYTMVMASFGPTVAAPAMVPNLPYDPLRDFTSVVSVATIPLVIVCATSLPVQTIAEFAALTKERQLDYASGGPGSTQHLAGELLRYRLGLQLNHVAYRGSAPAMTDLLAGVVPAMVDSVASALPHIRAGRIRALAVTSASRAPWLPDVPTVAETLIPDYAVQSWSGLIAPTGTPEAVIARAGADVLAIVARPEVQARLLETGNIADPGDAAAFGKVIREDVLRWRQIVRDANIRIDG